MQKKGQIDTLHSIIITLLIIGIVIGIGFLVLTEFGDTMGDTTTTVANETITLTGNNVYVVNNHTTSTLYCYNSFTVLSVINATGATVAINSGNYTYSELGSIINTTSEFPIAWNVSYSYKHSTSEGCQGLDETINATEEIPGWLAIIVILFVVGILLAIAFKTFPKSGSGGSISYGSSGASGTIAEI